MSKQSQFMHVQANTGPVFWGPGDTYTFLVTGEQSGGAYFILDALVGPGGGPPPHFHEREDECFYLISGTLALTAGDRTTQAGPGDFVQIPRGMVHTFQNTSDTPARMLAFFSPAGMEGWFAESLDPAPDRTTPAPPPTAAMIARMLAAAPKHGVAFV